MNRFAYSLFFFLLLGLTASAQKSTRGTLEYQKGEKTVAVIEMPHAVEIVEGAIRNRLESATVKEQRLKGMQVFKGGRLTPTDGEVVDFYFKVDRKGKKEDSTSVVYLILGRPNENVALRPLNDDFRVADGQQFLDQLVPEVSAFKLEKDIATEEEEIRKAEKNVSNLLAEQKTLEVKIRDLQERLAQNKRDQESQTAELARRRSVKDALAAKRSVRK